MRMDAMSLPTVNVVLEPWEVEQAPKRINPNQAAGTDRTCVFCEQFIPSNTTEIFHHLPSAEKDLTCDKDHHYVALASLPMKSFERLVLPQLQKDV